PVDFAGNFPPTTVLNVVTVVQGHLKGYDHTINLILEQCHERIFSPTAGCEQVPIVLLGLYIVRGDNM
ncbi:unnamed protein product, partial [Choristocarpus tenellus]